MGSKPVRERHHQLYGSTTSSLHRTNQFEDPDNALAPEELRVKQQDMVDRLSRPKHKRDKPKQKARGLSPGNATMSGSHMGALFGGDITWMYEKMKLTKEEVNMNPTRGSGSSTATVLHSPSFKKAIRIIDRLMKAHDIPQTDGLKRKEIEAIRPKYGVLFDIITTRRVILSGEPHKVGTELYRYLWSKYHSVQFAFIGITDNGAKRVARDVFCKDQLPNSAEEVYAKYITKSNFDVLDDDHMYIIFPENDGFIDDIIATGIEQQKIEKEMRDRRYLTQKYQPPTPPDFVVKHQQKIKNKPEPPTGRCDVCSPISILNNVTLATPGEWTRAVRPTSPPSPGADKVVTSSHPTSPAVVDFGSTGNFSDTSKPRCVHVEDSTITSRNATNKNGLMSGLPPEMVTARTTPWVKRKHRSTSPTYATLMYGGGSNAIEPSALTISTLKEEIAAHADLFNTTNITTTTTASQNQSGMSGTLQSRRGNKSNYSGITSHYNSTNSSRNGSPKRKLQPLQNKRGGTRPSSRTSTISGRSSTWSPGPSTGYTSRKTSRPNSVLSKDKSTDDIDDFDPADLLRQAEQRINEMNLEFKRRAKKEVGERGGVGKITKPTPVSQTKMSPANTHHQEVFNILMEQMNDKVAAGKYQPLQFPNSSGSL